MPAKPKHPATFLTWNALQPYLKTATEKECLDLLKKEVATKKRHIFVLRLYGRYSRLRRQREMDEIFSN